MSLEWEKLYKLGTDVAGFALYHPSRLAHRKDDPLGWWGDKFADEFKAGRLVAFCTGSDGTFTLKFVQRPLTAAEERVLVAKESFRYDVQDGRLYWDNMNCLPSEDTFEDAEADQHGWLEVPNGPYRVTVHAMDWFSIPDAEREADMDISHYLVRFEPVSSLEDVPVPNELPWLLASKSWHAKRAAQRSAGPEAAPGVPKPGASPKSEPAGPSHPRNLHQVPRNRLQGNRGRKSS
jgi:hypothetical protein